MKLNIKILVIPTILQPWMTAHKNEPCMQTWFYLTFTIYTDSITTFLIVMIFRYFSFEVCFVNIIKVMSWWWYVKLGLNPLRCWLKIEWRSWRQEVGHPIGRRMSGQTEERVTQYWQKPINRRKTAILRNSSLQQLFKLISLSCNH